MHRDGCRRVAIANDQEAYGYGLAALMGSSSTATACESSGASASTRLPGATARTPIAPGAARGLLHFRGHHREQCRARDRGRRSGDPPREALRRRRNLPERVHRSAAHGIPASIGRRFKCTVLNLPLNAYPGGPHFASAPMSAVCRRVVVAVALARARGASGSKRSRGLREERLGSDPCVGGCPASQERRCSLHGRQRVHRFGIYRIVSGRSSFLYAVRSAGLGGWARNPQFAFG